MYAVALFHKGRLGKGSFEGSGFIVDPRHILTCYHVGNEASKINLAVWNGRSITIRHVRGQTEAAKSVDLALYEIIGEPLSVQPPSFLVPFRDLTPVTEYGFTAASGEQAEPITHFQPWLTKHPNILQIPGSAPRGFSGSYATIRWNTQELCIGITTDGGKSATGFYTSAQAIKNFLSANGIHVHAVDPLEEEVRKYLETLAERCAELPGFFPERLKALNRDLFDHIRQKIRVVADRREFERWRAETRERARIVVPLAISSRLYDPRMSRPESSALGAEAMDKAARPEILQWDEQAESPRFRQTVILGDPGYGKSWLLRHEARRLALAGLSKLVNDAEKVDELVLPVLIHLSDLELVARTDRIEDAVCVHLKTQDHAGSLFAIHVAELFSEGRVTLLLDAWDEVLARSEAVDGADLRERFRTKVVNFSKGYQGRVLITSRSARYVDRVLPAGAAEVELLAFGRPEVEAYAARWFGSDPERGKVFVALLDRHDQVNGLAKIPLLLTLLCLIFEKPHETEGHQDEFPGRRVEVHEKALRRLLIDWKKEKTHKRDGLDAGFVEALTRLSRAGYQLFPKEKFGEMELAEALGWDPNEGKGAEDFIAQIAGYVRDGIFAVSGHEDSRQYLFLHRTFHEFLTAECWARRANKKGWESIAEEVTSNASRPEWLEVIPLLVGRLNDPLPLLRWLGEQSDRLCRPLALAVRCLAEVDAHKLGQQPLKGLAEGIAVAAGEIWWGAYQRSILGAYPALDRVTSFIVDLDEGSLLTTLTRGLSNPDRDVQRLAAQALGDLGAKGATEPVLAALVENLGDPNASVRSATAEALQWTGAKAATDPVLAALVENLGDPNARVRSATAKALERMGTKAATDPVLLALVPNLYEPDEDFSRDACRSAARALGELCKNVDSEPVLAALVQNLGHPNPNVGFAAAEALQSIGVRAATDPVLAALVDNLNPGKPKICTLAAATLGSFGEKAATAPVLAALMRILSDPNTAAEAAKAIGALGESAATEPIRAALTRKLSDPEPYVRMAAAKVLGKLGEAPANERVLAALVQNLGCSDSFVRRLATEALGQLGEKAATQPVLAALVPNLSNPNNDVRRYTSYALDSLGEAATELVFAAHLQNLKDPAKDVRAEADSALRKMRRRVASKLPIESLVQNLGELDPDVRNSAAEALGSLGEKAATEPVLTALVRSLSAPDVRESAAHALGDLGKKLAAGPLLVALLQRLREVYADAPSPLVNRVLKELGDATATERWLAECVSSLRHWHPDIRGFTAQALSELGEKASTPSVLEALVLTLGDPDTDVCWAATCALGEMGEKAANATVLSALWRNLYHPIRNIRRASAEALGRLQGFS
jgi:HEAT repeat protein